MDDSLNNVSAENLELLSDLFKVFADLTRIKIMNKLFDRPTNVSDIAESLNMSQSAISHQLKYLKDENLVKSQRDGKLMLYSLADDHVKTIFKNGTEHINELMSRRKLWN